MEPDASPPLDAPDADALFETTYAEFKRLARSRLRSGGRDVLLDTTALVHETYLKLGPQAQARFPDRPRFLVYASRVMRSVIIDLVRQRRSERRGGGLPHLTLTGDVIELAGAAGGEEQILNVHEALEALEEIDGRMAKVVEMRFFAGLTDAEIAAALGVTDRTVRRDWVHARLFLAKALK
jgi:RNA polymerase sigma factor (TIGR02999 family)